MAEEVKTTEGAVLETEPVLEKVAPNKVDIPKFESAEEFNKFIQSTASTAKNDLLKTMGIKSTKEVKEALDKLKEYETAALSESEKSQLAIKAKEAELAETKAQLARYQARETLASVVKSGFEDYVYFQVKDEPDIAVAAANYVKQYPQFAKEQTPDQPGIKTFGAKTKAKEDTGFEGPISSILSEKYPGLK